MHLSGMGIQGVGERMFLFHHMNIVLEAHLEMGQKVWFLIGGEKEPCRLQDLGVVVLLGILL